MTRLRIFNPANRRANTTISAHLTMASQNDDSSENLTNSIEQEGFSSDQMLLSGSELMNLPRSVIRSEPLMVWSFTRWTLLMTMSEGLSVSVAATIYWLILARSTSRWIVLFMGGPRASHDILLSTTTSVLYARSSRAKTSSNRCTTIGTGLRNHTLQEIASYPPSSRPGIEWPTRNLERETSRRRCWDSSQGHLLVVLILQKVFTVYILLTPINVILDARLSFTVVKGVAITLAFTSKEELARWGKIKLPNSSELRKKCEEMSTERIGTDYEFEGVWGRFLKLVYLLFNGTLTSLRRNVGSWCDLNSICWAACQSPPLLSFWR